MKEINSISKGINYNAISLGSLCGLNDYVLTLSPEIQIPGKVFIGHELMCSGAEISFQVFEPGSETGFLHSHHTHEEIYIFINGKGELQVDGEIFTVGEGSVIRVSPSGKRSVRNNGNESLTMICIQYKSIPFGEEDAADAVILSEKVKWSK